MVAELSTNQQHRLLSLAGVCLQNKWTKVAVAVAVAGARTHSAREYRPCENASMRTRKGVAAGLCILEHHAPAIFSAPHAAAKCTQSPAVPNKLSLTLSLSPTPRPPPTHPPTPSPSLSLYLSLGVSPYRVNGHAV